MFKRIKSFAVVAIILTAIFSSIPVANAANNDVLGSIVMVNTYEEQSGQLLWDGGGSGTMIDPNGLILTNYHVLVSEDGTLLDAFEICFLITEFEEPYCDEFADIVAFDEELDLALLLPYVRWNGETEEYEEIPVDDEIVYTATTFSTTSYSLINEVTLRDQISIIGYPGASLTGSINVTSGQVTSFESVYDEDLQMNLIISIETDALINPGNSGGGAFDSNDRFIGIPTAVSTGGISGQYGYIIPVTTVNMWLDLLVENQVLPYNPNIYVYGESQMALEDLLANTDASDLSLIQQGTALFTDMDEEHENFNAVKYLKENKIIGGYPDGSFGPENDITRAELMKILALATGSTPDPAIYKNCFPDVAEDWYAKYVCYAKEQGWVEGYPDGTFKPGQNVVKVEAIKMIINTQGVILDAFVPTGNPYEDVDLDAWYGEFVAKAKELGILEETGALYKPGENADRGSVSENIYRLIK